MFVVSQLSAADLPCRATDHFDPWLRTFWAEEEEEEERESGSLTVAVVSVLCVTSVAATALLVFSLYRQQQRARGRDRYRLAGRMVGGHLNHTFRQDEAEMTEIRSIQPWPPATGQN